MKKSYHGTYNTLTGMNSFCDNPTSTSAPHTPGSVLTHDFMPLYAQTSQSGTNGTPINLSCSATSPSFNPNVLFGNHEIYKNFMESSSAGPIFTNDSVMTNSKVFQEN